jgi:hypothetical protein
VPITPKTVDALVETRNGFSSRGRLKNPVYARMQNEGIVRKANANAAIFNDPTSLR